MNDETTVKILRRLMGIDNGIDGIDLVAIVYEELIGLRSKNAALEWKLNGPNKLYVGPKEKDIRDAFNMWTKVKNPKTGKLEVNNWQVKRRKAEADLYLKPIS